MSKRLPADKPDFRALFEAAPGQFVVLAPDLTIVAASDAYLRATMTDRAQIVGHAIFDVFPDNPDAPDATGVESLRASLDRVRASLAPDVMAVQKYDIKRPESDGGGFEVRFWSPLNTPVVGVDGELRYIIHRVEDVTEDTSHGVARDIEDTNRRLQQANAELRRSQAFLDSVVENIPDAVFVKDARDLRFVRFNRAGEELHGRSRQEMIGRTDNDFFPKDQADFFIAKDRETLATHRLLDIPEEPLDTPEHGLRILHTKKIPILDERGEPAYLLGISEDITERKEAEDELRAARLEAERANRAKTDFLSQMSHELRTPLTAILGFSQLLEMDELTADQHSSVNHILQAGRHLLDLINEILDISRIETGQMTISAEPVAVDELLAEVASVMQPLAAARAISIVRLDSWAGHVLADRHRLRQVFLNLISNALKYNREGGSITIGCEPAATTDDPEAGADRVRISITDSGYGIAQEHLVRLFQPFDRLGAELGSIEGTGIGLALANGLVVAMGGSIDVVSELDVGTTFTIELRIVEDPLELYERTVLPTDDEPRERPSRTILQIEDNVSNVRLVERIIERRPDMRILTASQGSLGVELARSHRPDLILLDLHLPDMPGHQVLRLLKADHATRDIPVVVISADGTKTQLNRLLKAGVFGYLTKPLHVAEFLEMVDRAVYGAVEEPVP